MSKVDFQIKNYGEDEYGDSASCLFLNGEPFLAGDDYHDNIYERIDAIKQFLISLGVEINEIDSEFIYDENWDTPDLKPLADSVKSSIARQLAVYFVNEK